MARRQRLQKLDDTSLAERAKGLIRDAIFEGKVRPEERLTIERIADELGISRTPVREALKALESDGIVRLLPRRGAIIASFTKDEIYDRYTVRAMIEGYAGFMACKRQQKTLAEKLVRDCETLARLIEQNTGEPSAIRRLIEANGAFHRRILDASESTTAIRTLDALAMPVAYKVFFWQERHHQRTSLEWHQQIANAFARANAGDVRHLMENHLIEARDYLMAIHQEAAESDTSRSRRRTKG